MVAEYSDPFHPNQTNSFYYQFFIALWEQLQIRAKAAEDQTNVAGGMSYGQIKDCTSSAVGTEEDGGVLFDETIDAYTQRREKAKEFLIDALVESHQKAFRPYLQRAQWTTISEDPPSCKSYKLQNSLYAFFRLTREPADLSQLSTTAELDEPLSVRKTHLDTD